MPGGADNLTFTVELVNGILEAVVDKLLEGQKEVRELAGRGAAGRRTETPVTRRQMPRVAPPRRTSSPSWGSQGKVSGQKPQRYSSIGERH